MEFDESNHDTFEDNIRHEKLLELEKRQQALQRLCEEALKEDEVETDLPPYLAPPSTGGAYGTTQFSPLPQRDVLTDDLLTGEVQSFRDPNSLGRASSMNSGSRAPSAPQGAYMPPRRSASRDYGGFSRPLSRPFVPRATLRTVAPPQAEYATAASRRAWSAHTGINRTPMRDTSSPTRPAREGTSRDRSAVYRNRYFGVVDTPADSTPSPRKSPYGTRSTKFSSPPPPPSADIFPPERSRSNPGSERRRHTRVPPPPPPRADRALYPPRARSDLLDPPPPPPRSAKQITTQKGIPPPPPPVDEEIPRRVAPSRAARRKAPALSSPSVQSAFSVKTPVSRAARAPPPPLSLAEAYSRYAPPASYREAAVKHFFREEIPSPAASVAESSSFTSYFSSVSKVEQWRSQLQSNDDALEARRHHDRGAGKRTATKKVVAPPPPPPPQLEPTHKSGLVGPPPPVFASVSEAADESVSVWENESLSTQHQEPVQEPVVRGVFNPEPHPFPAEEESIISGMVSIPPLSSVAQRVPKKEKPTGAYLHPYATNAPPPLTVDIVGNVPFATVRQDVQPTPNPFSAPNAQHVQSTQANASHDFFDESPAKAALQRLLVTKSVSRPPSMTQSQPQPDRQAAADTVQPSSNMDAAFALHSDVSPQPMTTAKEPDIPAPRAETTENDVHLKERLQEAQTKTEALARHLVKAINEKTMLAENVRQLEDLVEESTFEVGRLQRVVVEQQKEQSVASEVLAVLRAKEREIAVYEDEIQRLNSAVDRHLLRVASKEETRDKSVTRLHADDVDAAMTEVGAAFLAQREAEERAAQLAGELEAAVEQIQTLDERLAEMERAQAANRLNSIRDAVADDGTVASRTATSTTPRFPSAAETEQWPLEARKTIAQLTAHAEGLIIQNTESARYASSVLRHADHSREELQQKLHGRSEEVELLQEQCVRLQREKSLLVDAADKMRHQLMSVKDDAQLVSELVRTSRDEAEQVMSTCATPPGKKTANHMAAETSLNGSAVKGFAQQVMRDFHAVSRFLAALREMEIGHDNGYEILVKLADGASPSEQLYAVPQSTHSSRVGDTPKAVTQQRIQKRRDFVVQAVQQALVGSSSASHNERPVTPLQPWARAAPVQDHDDQDELTEADSFEADREVEVMSRTRQGGNAADTSKTSSIYRDDTGIVLSDVRKATPRRDSENIASEYDHHHHHHHHQVLSPVRERVDRTQTTQPGSPDGSPRNASSPPTRIPFAVVDTTPPSVSRPLRLSSGTPADAPAAAVEAGRSKADVGTANAPAQNEDSHHHPTPSCNSSGMLSVSDIPFDNAEAEQIRQRRSREKAEEDLSCVASADDPVNTSPRRSPVLPDEDDVSPVIRPPTGRQEHSSSDQDVDDVVPEKPHSGIVSLPSRAPDGTPHDAIEAVDLLEDDFVLPSEQEQNAHLRQGKDAPEPLAAPTTSKSPVPPHSLPPLAPSPQITPSQSPVPIVVAVPEKTQAESAPPQQRPREEPHVPTRRRVDDEDDDEDNEPSLFFYPASSDERLPAASASKESLALPPSQPQPSAPMQPETAAEVVSTTGRSSLASSIDRDSNSNLFHHRPSPSAGVSVGGAALPRLQRSATSSPQTTVLASSLTGAPAPQPPAATTLSHNPPRTSADRPDTTTPTLHEPHKASPSKSVGPRASSGVAPIPEELSSVEDDMVGTPENRPVDPADEPPRGHALTDHAEAEEEEPARRSGTARPSSVSHRLVDLSGLDDPHHNNDSSSHDDEDGDEVTVQTASPSPKAARGEDRDDAQRQRSTTAPGESTSVPALGLPSEPSNETPASLPDMPLPAEPLSAPAKPSSSTTGAGRPRAAAAPKGPRELAAVATAPAALPRANDDPPEPRLSTARTTAAAATSTVKAPAEEKKSPETSQLPVEKSEPSVTAETPVTPVTPVHSAVPVSNTTSTASADASPQTDSPRQRRKEEVARILERLRLKKEEEAARKKEKEAKAAAETSEKS